MRLVDKMVDFFTKINRRMKRWQRVVSVLSAIVVFTTTYLLIMPAITLDKETATTQAGVEIAESENNVEENGTVYESEPEEETSAEEEAVSEEVSSSESGAQEAEDETPAVEDKESEEDEDQSVPAEKESSLDTQQEDDVQEDERSKASSTAAVSDDTDAEKEEENADNVNSGNEAASTETTEEAIAASTGKPADEIELITEDTRLVFEADDYYVYADFGASAELPVGVKLDVKEITEESDPEAYAFYYEKALAEMQDKYDEKTGLSLAKFYDITFKYEGVEIEPRGDVKVRIEYKESVEVEKETKVDAVHFESKDENEEPLKEEKAVVLDENKVEADRSETEVNAVEFESDKFSVYGIVYTVDFKWEVDGRTYEYSLPGGGFMSFEALMEVLGVASGNEDTAEFKKSTSENASATDVLTVNDVQVSEDTERFVADVSNVEFSKPELVWVGKVEEDTSVGDLKEANNLECQYSAKLTEDQIAEINAQTAVAGDWALISVQPFLSHETLTVTMKNGEVFTIEVTDGQLHTYAISAAGDKYEITVTYDDKAGIPDDAKLDVREITVDSKEYADNVKKAGHIRGTENEPLVSNPVQFDISIVSNGVEIEPKEGSTVNVEIKLAQSLLNETDSENEISADGEAQQPESIEEEKKEGEIFINGQMIEVKPNEITECNVVHIADDGSVELISEAKTTVAEQKVVVEFETDSFSDYMVQGAGSTWDLNSLPSTIYVGDEIYLQNSANIRATNIGSVISETRHNNQSGYRSYRAENPGTFRMCHNNDWNGGNPRNYKEIRVLPKRTGTTPPRVLTAEDGIISNASIGLQVNLFDYDLDEYLDDRFNNYDYGNDNPATSAFLNHGINDGHALKFWGSGITNGYHGNLNQYVEHGVTSIVDSQLVGGYPKLKGYDETLEYLFEPANGTDKTYYGNVDGLFKKEGDYYIYDSNKNYAYYDGNKFLVYDGTYNQKTRGDGGEQASHTSDKKIGFFPFHPWDEDYDLYVNWNKNLNHHFGVSMSVDFALPQSPKAVKDTNGDDIIFHFSGDDDMWVFIDGKLAMDIGGIHQPTNGTINFTTKQVIVNGSRQTGFDFSNLYDGNKHTLQVFYLERGGCDSNCSIQFNITRYGDVDFEKVDDDDKSKLLQGAIFGLYKDSNCRTPLMENLDDGSSRAFVAESDANGKVHFAGIPLGTYYLKEIWAPDGYPIDSTVHKVVVFLDPDGRVKARTTIDGTDIESPGVKITNKHPNPINLGLKKDWKNADDEAIVIPEGVSTTFELKRIRSYETYTEEIVPGEGKKISKLIVGWIHDGETHTYKEYELISNTTATVSWSYVSGYEGEIGCYENGEKITKSGAPTSIYSEALTMPAEGQTATLYIIDDSDSGNAVSNINVAGSEYIGGSGGGIIHHFTTVTEPDPDFQYTGEHVTNNQVTLPIGTSWEYNFTNLPVFGSDADHVYSYSYYLEEVSSVSPAGTTVVYRDTNGNVVNTPSAAETSTSGTLNITNKVPVGYLRIDKEVTYNGVAPSTSEEKSALAGTYTFKVFTNADCTKPYKVIEGEGAAQHETELTLTITIEDDGSAKSSELVKLPIGDYWIEEVAPTQTGVTPELNRIKVTITANNTTEKPAIASFTNNKEDSDSPELAIELEKKFIGLPDSSKIPAGYKAFLRYTYNNETVDVPLDGSTQGNITCTKTTENGVMTWHWRIKGIPTDAKDFAVYEQNYDITGYTRITKINGKTVENPGTPQSIQVLVPTIEMTNISRDYTTEDNNKVFTVADNQILLVRMTSQATVIVSQKSLSYATRQAIEKMITDNGGKIPGDDHAQATWVLNFEYFSHEVQGDKFSYGGRTIFFEGNKVIVPHKSSSHEVRVDIENKSTTGENSFIIENEYTEIPTDVDVLKVEKGKETTTKLAGAEFELRKLEDVAPTQPGGTLTYVKDKNGNVIVTTKTTGPNGRLTFDNLTYGYYEIKETKSPPGYVLSEDIFIYFKVDAGTVTYLSKGTGKPSTWSNGTKTDYVEYTPKQSDTNATFTVGNTPGSELPHTGGPGTFFYTLSGFALIMASALMYGFSMRRRERRLK